MFRKFSFLICALVLSLTCASYADSVIGDFEDGSLDGFEVTWEGLATIATSDVGATTGSGALAVTPPTGWTWAVLVNVDPQVYDAVVADVTIIDSEWIADEGAWANFKELALNSDAGWTQLAPSDPANPDYPGTFNPGSGDQTRTLTWDISGYDPGESDWMQLVFSSNMGGVTTPGNWYLDNVQLIGGEPAEPKIVYVDATDGETGNTMLATGEIFTPVDVGTGGSGEDGLWRIRAYANSNTIYESGGSWEADLNTEDCPRLMTSVDVPEGNYDVYVYFWADSAQWRIQAALEDSEGDLPLYIANDPNSGATIAAAEDFAEPVPMLVEDNRTLWQAYIGTSGDTDMITVFIDDEAAHITGNSRTWYDGIGYKAATESEPEDTGLIAGYLFEGDASDSSGNGLDGVIMGDPVFIEGAIGQALDFDGDGDYVDCGASTLFDVTDAITVAAWVNIRSLPQAWTAVIAKGDSAWRISNNSSSMGMHFGFEDGSRGWQAANSATELNAGEWYHVAGVYDINVGAKIYINGAVDGTNDDTGGITHSDYPVFIAENSQALNRFWDGGIDEVMIYGRALSDDEVAALAVQ